MPRTAEVLDTANSIDADTAQAAGHRTSRQTSSDLAFLAHAMKAAALLDAAERLEERAMPNTSSPASSGRWPPENPTAAKHGSGRPASEVPPRCGWS
ncbi:hypothetical protein SNOUR_01210 [Streptomyces noursei ATCC 11455]|nr:hypothetical protein SNOUR_01210 [Streptomyces noursei ATCC 11455]